MSESMWTEIIDAMYGHTVVTSISDLISDYDIHPDQCAIAAQLPDTGKESKADRTNGGDAERFACCHPRTGGRQQAVA